MINPGGLITGGFTYPPKKLVSCFFASNAKIHAKVTPTVLGGSRISLSVPENIKFWLSVNLVLFAVISTIAFEKKAKEKLKPDRKDILLTGSGKIMMIHFLLLEKIESYKKE